MEKITKWCICRTPETADKINEWFSSKGKRRLTAKSDFHFGWKRNPSYWSYLHYPEHNGKHLHNKIIKGYTEITFEEFESEIYNNISILNKKIENFHVLREK